MNPLADNTHQLVGLFSKMAECVTSFCFVLQAMRFHTICNLSGYINCRYLVQLYLPEKWQNVQVFLLHFCEISKLKSAQHQKTHLDNTMAHIWSCAVLCVVYPRQSQYGERLLLFRVL